MRIHTANEELINLKRQEYPGTLSCHKAVVRLDGGLGLRIKWIGQLALLLLLFVGASQGVYAAPEQNSSENVASNPVSNTSTPVPSVEFVGIQGIWSVSLADTEITMELNQSGDTILGRCKFEGAEPWNGVLTGAISGKVANIAVAAMQGKLLVSMEMIGLISGDTVQGSYTSYDSDGNAVQDTFMATKINSDVSGYTPAQIAASSQASSTAAPEQPEAAEETPTTVGQQSQTPTTIGQPYQAPKSKVTDVTELAKGIDPNIMPRHTQL